ncbi:MAG: bifunctional riboflavin kinase/FAD synthetase [Candidatus Izimaplasma sp.]|nr:bifunctional riboflavin kinase/FAD synthetase [Candidatus Izimaplasma bacterium]
MRIEYIDFDDTIKDKNAIACLGFFDGLHIAHQKLIEKGMELKNKTGKQLLVFTFNQSIGKYLNNKPFYYLTSIEDKKNILEKYNVDVLYVFKVTKSFISMEPDEFIQQFLIDMDYLIVGYDFTYGFRSLGNVSHLIKFDEFETVVIPELAYQGEKIGSTRIRMALDDGDLKLASYLLGRYYQIKGKVIKGHGIGKLLGFPTANIDFTNYYLPKKGVYFTKTIINNKSYFGVTNVGKKPTFKDNLISLEIYIFDLDEDLYGQYITIEFIEYMREEVKYPNKELLIKQIKKDVSQAKDRIKRSFL